MSQYNIFGKFPTISDNDGLNIRPGFFPESFFFLEANKSFAQSSAEKFGITGSPGNSLFRTTAKISGYAGKIFTICQGQILLQPNVDNSKINLILKPFNQPIKGLAIKYFIYRGLNKNDFFDSNEIINTANTGSSSEFVNYIRKEFKELYETLNIPEPSFTAQYLGYPSTVPGEGQNPEDLIDDYFFKISQAVNDNGNVTEPAKKAYELPMIPRGVHLGNISGQIGIDVVLNEGDYSIENDPNPFKLNLKYARLSEHILNPASGGTVFKNKLIKESSTQFIDIAAFYGLHTHGKGRLHVSENGQNSVLQTNDDIYNMIRNFYTAKTTYLYIQGSRQRSYNFYGNYKVNVDNINNIKIGPTINNLTEEQFEIDWPLRELNNIPSIVVKLTTDNKETSALYVKQGLLSDTMTHEDNFIRGRNLLQENVNDIEFIKPIVFDISKTSDEINISSFIQIIYEGKVLPIVEPISSIPSENVNWDLKDIDDIFGLINVRPHIQNKSNNELHYVIDQNLLLINFDNELKENDIATITTKRVEDFVLKNDSETLKRVTYETLLNNIRQNISGFSKSRTAYQDNSNSGTITYSNKMNNFYRPESPYYLKKVVLTDTEGNIITGLSLQLEEEAIPSKKLLGITDDENEVFVAIIEDNALNNPKFYFKNELNEQSDTYTSSEGIEYKKYKLSVIGETQQGNLILVDPIQKITVITIDDMVFASEEYAKWMPLVLLTGNDNNIFERVKS